MNWTGHVIVAARTDLPELLRRDETQRTGVYFLLGDDTEGTGTPSAYIGEAISCFNTRKMLEHSPGRPTASRAAVRFPTELKVRIVSLSCVIVRTVALRRCLQIIAAIDCFSHNSSSPVRPTKYRVGVCGWSDHV